MKIEQFPYGSEQARDLRQRDGTPPWGVHPCELDSLGEPEDLHTPHGRSWLEAVALRQELEHACNAHPHHS